MRHLDIVDLDPDLLGTMAEGLGVGHSVLTRRAKADAVESCAARGLDQVVGRRVEQRPGGEYQGTVNHRQNLAAAAWRAGGRVSRRSHHRPVDHVRRAANPDRHRRGDRFELGAIHERQQLHAETSTQLSAEPLIWVPNRR